MKINRIAQPSFEQVRRMPHQLVVAACGYESRARAIPGRLDDRVDADTMRIALSFNEHKDNSVRRLNEAFFAKQHYHLTELNGSDAATAARVFREQLAKVTGPTEILIDISSMTRAWYGGIVNALLQWDREEAIVTRFAYLPAVYRPPVASYPPNELLGPVTGFASRALPDKPTALVIGLGYDPDRALGLKDYLDPQLTLLFFAEPASDERYVIDTKKANKELFETLRTDYCFSYPLTDCVTTFKLLESACRGLLREWRVVLCSLGPKPFGLICFLLAAYYPDISIWRVSAGGNAEAIDHVPFGEPLVFEVAWGGKSSSPKVDSIEFDELIRRQMVT